MPSVGETWFQAYGCFYKQIYSALILRYMKIIHLTDPHFGEPKPTFDTNALSRALNELAGIFCEPTTYLVLSGDVTYKGGKEGYEIAAEFFANTWLQHGGERKRFLACPGNHDLCDNKFNAFDAFVYGVRRDHDLAFEKGPSHVIKFDDVVFLCINSAHHREHKYGYVDCHALCRDLDLLDKTDKRKVAVIHHHVMGVYRDDASTIRNALQLISLLDSHNFELLIHGHQHAQADLVVGANQIKVYSGRSLNFATRGLVNGLAIYSYEASDWKRQVKVLSNDASLIAGQFLLTVENK
jgi:3',5'-cyclic AMP phosphodiesterase CpdA